jgi:hypothetical protein
MSLISTKWTEGDYIARLGLEAWHAADTTSSSEVFDASGNDRRVLLYNAEVMGDDLTNTRENLIMTYGVPL